MLGALLCTNGIGIQAALDVLDITGKVWTERSPGHSSTPFCYSPSNSVAFTLKKILVSVTEEFHSLLSKNSDLLTLLRKLQVTFSPPPPASPLISHCLDQWTYLPNNVTQSTVLHLYWNTLVQSTIVSWELTTFSSLALIFYSDPIEIHSPHTNQHTVFELQLC